MSWEYRGYWDDSITRIPKALLDHEMMATAWFGIRIVQLVGISTTSDPSKIYSNSLSPLVWMGYGLVLQSTIFIN